MSEPNSRPLVSVRCSSQTLPLLVIFKEQVLLQNEAGRLGKRSAARIVSIAAVFVGFSVRKSAMEPTQGEAVAGTISRSRVYFLVAQNDGIASTHFSASFSDPPAHFIHPSLFTHG